MKPVTNMIKSLIALALIFLPLNTLQAQLLDKKILTLEAAEKIAAAAEAEAKKRDATVVIVVVDDQHHRAPEVGVDQGRCGHEEMTGM